jgi:hypothetical protein
MTTTRAQQCCVEDGEGENFNNKKKSLLAADLSCFVNLNAAAESAAK